MNILQQWWVGESRNLDDPALEILLGKKRHWTSSIIHYLFEFWMRRWIVLFPVIIAALIALFIHFDYNSNSTGKTKQKENNQIINTNHNFDSEK